MNKNRGSSSQTITSVEEKVLQKTQKTLYLVLKKKGLEEEVIEKINNECEARCIEYLKKIYPKLNQMHFDNPEEALEYLLVKQMMNILDDMFKERIVNLKEADKKLVFDILQKKQDKIPEDKKHA